MRRRIHVLRIASVAILAISGAGARAADAASQNSILLTISARGQVTTRADKISIPVMVSTDPKSSKPQTLERLQKLLRDIGIGPEAVTPFGQKYGIVHNLLMDVAADQEAPEAQANKTSVYQIVLTDHAKYETLMSKLGPAGFSTVFPARSMLNDDRAARTASKLDAYNRALEEAQDLVGRLNMQFQRITKLDYSCTGSMELAFTSALTESGADGFPSPSDPQNVVTRSSVCMEFEATKSQKED
jgi:uncharacterized protein YggE